MENISLLAQYCQEIDHIAIVVKDLELAIKFFRDILGFEMLETSKVEQPEMIMDMVVFKLGKITFVIVQKTPLTPKIAEDIEHSSLGIRHIALRVDNIEAVIQDLRQRGLNFTTDLIDGSQTYQIFSQRDDNSDVMIEFIERKGNQPTLIFNAGKLLESRMKNKSIDDSLSSG